VHGEFLSGFSLKDSFEFDDWQLFQAEALRKELASALDALIHTHSAQRQFEPAIAYARHRLALDPLGDSSHRQLMRLYTWSGRRSAALAQYKECIALLHDQLGVSPDESTRRLHEDIQAGSIPPLPDAAALAAEVPPFLKGDRPVERPVFVARERELAQLEGYLDAALAGHGQVVFVIGDPGSGKTALIQEFIRRAQEAHTGTVGGPGHPLVVATGNCNAYTGIGDPYLPFREILELLTGDVEARWAAGAMTTEYVRRLWHMIPLTAQALLEAGPELIGTFVSSAALLERARTYTRGGADWLAGLDRHAERAPAGPGVPGPQQSDLFEEVTRVLQILARQVPLLLILDDLQWADLGSISLLFHLGRHLAGSRILVVGAYRPEEIAAGRDGQRHPLDPVVNELQRSLGDITVNLDQARSREFLEAFLDSEPNRLGTSFREMLYRHTRGHPLFTIELLRGLQERGDLVQDRIGRWVEGAMLNWETLPARVEAAIRERIGRLAEPLQAALQVASIEGEVFTAEVVTRVLGIDERVMVQRLSSELDRRHHLVGAEAIERLGPRRISRYRFRNYLFQKYLYDSLDQVERTYLHESVGNVLEILYGDRAGEIAVQLARHFQEAGFTEKAIHYLHRAGEMAVQLSAYPEAVMHMTRGLDLLMTLPSSPERTRQELDLRLALGIASIGFGNFTPKDATLYARARELSQQAGQTAQLCQALGTLAIYHYVRSEHHRARALAEESLCQAQRAESPPLVAWSRWLLGFILFGLGEFTLALEQLEQVTAFHANQEGIPPAPRLSGADAGLSALAYKACCLWCLGYPEQALKQREEALALARNMGHRFTLGDVLCYGGCLLDSLRRDAAGLEVHAGELWQVAEKIPTWFPPGNWYLGESAALSGRLQEGIVQMRAAVGAQKSAYKRCDIARVLGALATARAKAGCVEEGLDTLAEALSLVEETDERYMEAELYRLRAELLIMQGNEEEASSSLHRAIDVARRQSARSWELRATTSLARLWRRQGRIDEARQALAPIYHWFTEGFDTPDLREAGALLAELA
jgi:predicted ATPase